MYADRYRIVRLHPGCENRHRRQTDDLLGHTPDEISGDPLPAVRWHHDQIVFVALSVLDDCRRWIPLERHGIVDEQCTRCRDNDFTREQRKEHQGLEEGEDEQRERPVETQEPQRDGRQIDHRWSGRRSYNTFRAGIAANPR